MMTNDNNKSGNTACWKDIIASGVRVYPRIRHVSNYRRTNIAEEGGRCEDSPPAPIDTITLENLSMV